MEIRNKQIIFDSSDWLAGLHPRYSSAVTDTPVPLGGRELTFASNMNPYRNFGYASPGFNPADVTNVSQVTTAPIRNIVIAYDSGAGSGTGFAINGGDRLFEIDSLTGALTSDALWPRTITVGTTRQGQSIIGYNANVSSTSQMCLFYSWIDSGASQSYVGRYTLSNSAAGFDDDFMQTVPAGFAAFASDKKPLPMIVGDDDILYIGFGNKLYGYDGATGADGTLALSLTLPAGLRITSFAKTKLRLHIFGYYEQNASASATVSTFLQTRSVDYEWDYLSLDPVDSYELDDNAVTCAVNYGTTIVCFTQGRRPVIGAPQKSKLMLFNGSDYEAVAMFDKDAPIHGGAEVVGETIMWNSEGTVFQWGSPYIGFPNGLNIVAAGSGTTSGTLRTISLGLQLISSGTTTSGGLQTIISNFTTGSFASGLATPQFPNGKQGRVTSVDVEFAKTSSGGREFTLSLIGNSTATVGIISGVSTIDSTNQSKRYTLSSGGVILSTFVDLKVIGQWATGSAATDAPILKKVTVNYDEVNING